MQLTYRGQTYTSSQTIARVNPHTVLTYRSQSYQPRRSPAMSPKANLVYRGVPYLTSELTTSDGLTSAFS